MCSDPVFSCVTRSAMFMANVADSSEESESVREALRSMGSVTPHTPKSAREVLTARSVSATTSSASSSSSPVSSRFQLPSADALQREARIVAQIRRYYGDSERYRKKGGIPHITAFIHAIAWPDMHIVRYCPEDQTASMHRDFEEWAAIAQMQTAWDPVARVITFLNNRSSITLHH